MGGAASSHSAAKVGAPRNECTASTLAPVPAPNPRLSSQTPQTLPAVGGIGTPSASPGRPLFSEPSTPMPSSLPTQQQRPLMPRGVSSSPLERRLSAVSSADRDMLHFTTMSLGMDPEDLLFNMMYFGDHQDNSQRNMGSMINAVIEETIAAHSENNTPYKLKPVPSNILAHVRSETLQDIEDLDDKDCAVCKEEFEIGSRIILLNKCSHRFHGECLRHWLHMVSLSFIFLHQ